MAKKPGSNPKGEFVMFDVIYEDGSQRSNRRVPAELLGGLEKDEPALGFIIEQDRDIAEKSGRAPLQIKSIARTGAKPKKAMGGEVAGPDDRRDADGTAPAPAWPPGPAGICRTARRRLHFSHASCPSEAGAAARH